MSDIEYREERPLSFSSPESKQAAVAVAEAFLGDEQPEDAEQPVAAVPMVVPSIPAPNDLTEGENVVEMTPEPLAAEPAFDFSKFEPNLSPDLAELLEDEPPDFDAEALAEIRAEQQAFEDTGEYAEQPDPGQAAKERALQKRVDFLESRLVETNRGKWVTENLRAYPLVAQYAKDELQAIDVNSRRAFAREAARLNEQVTKIAKPLLDDLSARLAARGDAVTVERREQVDAAWGKPAADLAATGASAERLARVQAARKTEDLGAVLRAHLAEDTSSVL